MKKGFFLLGLILLFCIPLATRAATIYSTTTDSFYNMSVTPNTALTPTHNYMSLVNVPGSYQGNVGIKFTIPAIVGTINSVTLVVTVQEGTPFTAPVYVYAMTQNNWLSSTATWNSYDTGQTWSTPGGDYASSSVGSGYIFNYQTGGVNALTILPSAIISSSSQSFLLKIPTNILAPEIKLHKSGTTSAPYLIINYGDDTVSTSTDNNIEVITYHGTSTVTGSTTVLDGKYTASFLLWVFAYCTILSIMIVTSSYSHKSNK